MSTYPVWGWGGPADEPRPADLAALAPAAAELLGFPVQEPERAAPLPDLPPDRVGPRLPASLADVARADPLDRARHALGRSYRDVVRGLRADFPAVPDCVLRPLGPAQLQAVLDWCGEHRTAVIPFGGGTSVVGGVEPAVGDGWAGVVSLDLGGFAGVHEIDDVSRAARVGAGTTGPRLEEALGAAGWTARFYPQSFQRSTVGGWVATRAAGHFSTGPTHVDDLVESVHAVTPAGAWESRRLPASGAGPSPDRMLLGSEGTLGVITEAWLRIQPRPVHRWAATCAAATFPAGLAAVRALAQSGLAPATCRLLDPGEAMLTGTLGTGEAALVLGFESVGPPVDAAAEQAVTLCRDAGLRVVESGPRGAAGAAWREAFLRMPFLREQLVLLGVLVETFETAATWAALPTLVEGVIDRTTAVLHEVCGGGRVTCRLTHVYPDGAAPYFTVLAPARRGGELSQWAEIKQAATDVILDAGGTVTHHHAVGRDHRRWYDAQRPPAFAAALSAAKRELDPHGVLNPGVLLP